MTTPRVPLAPDPRPHRVSAAAMPAGRALTIALLGGPVAWVVHLLGVYLLVAVWCGNRLRGAGVAIAVLTVACAVAAIAVGVLAFRLWRRGQEALAADAEPGTPESWDARMGERGARGVFLAVMGLFMAAIFAFLIVLQGLPPAFTPVCPATTVP